MNLAGALEPLTQLSGFVAGVVFTQDGLPVEQVGSRFAAEELAAELAGMAEASRQTFGSLTLGDVRQFSVSLTAHDVTVLMLPGYLLGLVFERGSGSFILAPSLERAIQPLRGALGGRR